MKPFFNLALFLSACLLLTHQAQAKKVKFSVNMSGQTISPNGIHLTGDFQTLAGYPNGDWQSNTTVMTRETSDTNIYSVVVDIPAHRKYEFKFVNGDLFYEAEFVPEESRVGYDFIDNRWIYIDSLINDTTQVGPLLFGGNAPLGKKLLRLKVDLRNQSSISNQGIHVAGSFQSFEFNSTRMYSFSGTTFEYQAYVDSGTVISYQFVNGNTSSDAEAVPVSCANSTGRREVSIINDVVLDSICFGQCTICEISSGAKEAELNRPSVLYPNPSSSTTTLSLSYVEKSTKVLVLNMNGEVVQYHHNLTGNTIELKREHLSSGIYIIQISNVSGSPQMLKWVIE